MGYNPVYSHLGSQTNTSYHITHLADNMICEEPASIILKHCIDNTIDRHNNAHDD